LVRVKADIQTQRMETAAQDEPSSWWPLDWLRSLGRAASIAAGHPEQSQTEYRGFHILATGQDGAYFARITHHGGRAVRSSRQIRQHIDASRFGSREEALQHARFAIASGAFNHLIRDADGNSRHA
jgi:hypothetical protein